MDPYRTVFYNQVKQLPTLDVDTIARCNERVLALSNNRVDTIRLAAILAYGTDEQWRAAWHTATTWIGGPSKRKDGIKSMSDDCVGALFYWIRELAPKRLYTAQTAERFYTLRKHGDEIFLRLRNFDWIQLLFQARFHEAALIMPNVMLGLGFREEVLFAVPELLQTGWYYSLRALAYSMNDAELYAVAFPGKEWSVKNHKEMLRPLKNVRGAYYTPSLYDQWALIRYGDYCWEDQNFKYYTQTLADLKDCILQTASFRVKELREFEHHVDISPESPGDFFNQVCAAKYLGVLLGVAEGYYRCASPALERVCAIAARLPTDLQHVLALRMAGSVSEVLPQRLADRAYFELDVEPDEYVKQHIQWDKIALD